MIYRIEYSQKHTAIAFSKRPFSARLSGGRDGGATWREGLRPCVSFLMRVI